MKIQTRDQSGKKKVLVSFYGDGLEREENVSGGEKFICPRHVLIKRSQRKLKFVHCFSLDRAGRGNTPRRSPRLSLVREKLRTKLFEKLHATKTHALVDNERRQCELNVLQNLKQKVDNFEPGVHSEVELTSSSRNIAFLSVSASPEKSYSEYAGSYLPVKLLISPSGDYEVRVNILDCAERGNVDLQNDAAVRQLVLKISVKSQYKICPGLTKTGEFDDLQGKLSYVPKCIYRVMAVENREAFALFFMAHTGQCTFIPCSNRTRTGGLLC